MKKRYNIIIIVMISIMHGILGASSIPTMSRIYGSQYVKAIPDSQQSGLVGQLVPTGVFGTQGSINVSGTTSNQQASAVNVSDTGLITVVFNDDSNSYLAQYKQDGAINTAFASGTNNILELAGMPYADNSLLVDKQNRMILAGTFFSGSDQWIIRVTPEGTIDTTFNFTDTASWTSQGSINRLSMQSSGKIVAVGSNGSYAMLGRYNLDGSLDTSFGMQGHVILDDTRNYPMSIVGLNTIVVDANNNIYIAYLDTDSVVHVIRLTQSGLLDTTWNEGIPLPMTYLNGSSHQPQELCMVMNSALDLVIAIPSGSPKVIKAASIQASNGAAGSFADFSSSGGVFGSDSYTLLNMIATTDDNVYFVGSDSTTNSMAIICTTNAGVLHTSFNQTDTPGVSFFYPTGSEPANYGYLSSIALAPSGQIFTLGTQQNNAFAEVYLSCLYGYQYAQQMNQFPEITEQGTRDFLFGATEIENYDGVVTPYIGLYRDQLQQKGKAVTELASGNILVGQNGYSNTSNLSSMMLVRLTPEGLLDTSFGAGAGTLILPNLSSSNEYVNSILEDSLGNIYVTGYSDFGAIFRKYTSAGILVWNSDYTYAGFQGLSSTFQNATSIFVFLSGPGNTGQINAYNIADGSFDTTFHSTGTTPGVIESTDYNLNMGPLYSGVVSNEETVFVAYKNNISGAINAVHIVQKGGAVLWNNQNVFSNNAIGYDNVRVSFNNDGNLAIVAGYETAFLAMVLNTANGLPAQYYQNPLVIECGTALQVTQVIGVSDDTIVLGGYDDATADMIVVRINPTGDLDTTFNSQGPIPGVISLQLNDQTSSSYAGVISGIMLQSTANAYQGEIIVTGYEQILASQATPVVMRFFGTPGTTQVKSSPVVSIVPGTFDVTYNGTGIAPTYVLGASDPTANQEVRAIRQLSGTQIMTVVTDNTTSISYTQRLNADSSIDTTYADGLGIAIVKLTGTETIQSMTFDGAGNMLITGTNSSLGGFLKRVLPDGSADLLFGGYTGVASTKNYPLGTVYGLMDVVNACQQLTNGNIVLVGQSQGIGIVQMLTYSGALITTFAGTGQVQQGSNITSVSVDPNNNIYAAVAYVDTDSIVKAGILKLDSTGQPVSSFGINGFVASALTEIDNNQSLQAAFDQSLRVVIAGSSGGVDGSLVVNRYTADGGVDTTFNGGVQCTTQFFIPANIVVTSIAALQDNKTLISGYQFDTNNPEHDFEFIVSIDAVGLLDQAFGVQSIPGIVTFQASNTPQLLRTLLNLNVQSNGNILLAGGEIPASNEETPLTFRFNGFDSIQSVPQYTGYQSSIPNVLDTYFNGNGIAQTDIIGGLITGGSVATDTTGNIFVAGATSGTFVVSKFLKNGLLDTIANGGSGFGTNGTAATTRYIDGLSSQQVAVDRLGNIYVSGFTSGDQLVVARFTSTGSVDNDFGSGGIASSVQIPYLLGGGYVSIDINSKVVLAGYTSDSQLVVTRFLYDGRLDDTFAPTTNNISSSSVSSLQEGGTVVTDNVGNIYVGGRTLTEMIIIMLDQIGVIDTGYGNNGKARTQEIAGLYQGGSIALDNLGKMVIAGLTTNQSFVVSRFTIEGNVDTTFNTTGIAYSLPIDVLNTFGNVTIDKNQSIVVGGVASLYDGTKAMITARFISSGILDTTFSSTGMATTGSITNIIQGGFVTTDIYNNVISGALIADLALLVTKMYSGEQIFVENPTILNFEDIRSYYYGNNPAYLRKVLNAEYYIRKNITSGTLSVAAKVALESVIDNYIAFYSDVPGWNLVWHLYSQVANFEIAQEALITAFAESADEINSLFADIADRSIGMRYSS